MPESDVNNCSWRKKKPAADAKVSITVAMAKTLAPPSLILCQAALFSTILLHPYRAYPMNYTSRWSIILSIVPWLFLTYPLKVTGSFNPHRPFVLAPHHRSPIQRYPSPIKLAPRAFKPAVPCPITATPHHIITALSNVIPAPSNWSHNPSNQLSHAPSSPPCIQSSQPNPTSSRPHQTDPTSHAPSSQPLDSAS